MLGVSRGMLTLVIVGAVGCAGPPLMTESAANVAPRVFATPVEYRSAGDSLVAQTLRKMQPDVERLGQTRNRLHDAANLTTLVGGLGGVLTAALAATPAKWVGFGASVLTAGIAYHGTRGSIDDKSSSCISKFMGAQGAWNADRMDDTKVQAAFATLNGVATQIASDCPWYRL